MHSIEKHSTLDIPTTVMASQTGQAEDVVMEDESATQVVQENEEAKAMIARECQAVDEKQDTNVLEAMEGGMASGVLHAGGASNRI